MLEKEPDWSLFHSSAGWVYVVEAGGFYKIGSSKNVEKRLSNMQTACPHKINLIFKIFFPANVVYNEKYIQKYMTEILNSTRIRGEWFKFNDYHIMMINSMCDAYLSLDIIEDMFSTHRCTFFKIELEYIYPVEIYVVSDYR